MININKDLEFGLNEEKLILQKLKYNFSETIERTKSKYSSFDFEGDNIKIELKSRRNASDLYPTTMIGHRKILAANNSDIHYYYVFKYTDKILYCQYNKEDFKNFEVKKDGRSDRTRIESNNYIYIPISYLCELL